MKPKIENIKFDERGLVPVVVQDARRRSVLMLA
jgi:phosphoribosyl-AMP cyclohydrolase